MSPFIELSSTLGKKHLVLVLIPGLVVPLFIQFPEWTAILGSLTAPESAIVFGVKLLWDIVVIGVLSSVAFEVLVFILAVLRTVDERYIRGEFGVISGIALFGAIGVLLLYGYQFNEGKNHISIPPWVYAYICAVLIAMQAGYESK